MSLSPTTGTLSSGTGLVSGLNYEDIISKLQAVNQQPIRLLQSRQTQSQAKIAAFSAINSQLLSLQKALDNLNSPDTFLKVTGSSSDSNVLSVAATSSAVGGAYSVQVVQLAQAERRATQGVATADTVIASGGGGSFSFKVGSGQVQTITVDGAMTLAQFRDAINNAKAGVRASIVNDGSAGSPYRLALSVDQSGASNGLQILANDTTLNFEKSIGAAQAATGNTFDGVAAASGTYAGSGSKTFTVKITDAGDGSIGSAKFKVSTDGGTTWGSELATSGSPVDIGDGVKIAFSAGTAGFTNGDQFTIAATDPFLQHVQDGIINVDGINIQRSTNTFDAVIEGVTFTAKKASDTPVTAQVTVDKGNAVGTITAFASAYTAVMNTINQYASYDATTNTAGPLFSDSTVASIRSQLAALLTRPVAGTQGHTLRIMGEVGVSLTRTGTLQVDNAKLTKALNDNFDDVKALFTTTGSTRNSNLSLYSAASAKASGGSFAVFVTTVAEQAHVAGTETIDAGTGLSANETLTFTVGDTNVSANLASGDHLADVITKINDKMKDAYGIEAYDEGGKLALRTVEYGSSATIKVVSDKAGAGSTGIGTTQQTDTGVDVAGLINNRVAKGVGRVLTGATGTDSDGFQIQVLATTTGNAGSIDISRGIATSFTTALAAITNTSDGLIKTRTDGLNKTIESTNKNISDMQTRVASQSQRLRAQFNTLETQLASLQSLGTFLTNTLAQIAAGWQAAMKA